MWFYILLTTLVVLFVWWLTRTNLYRHRSRHGPEPEGRGRLGQLKSDGRFQPCRAEAEWPSQATT